LELLFENVAHFRSLNDKCLEVDPMSMALALYDATCTVCGDGNVAGIEQCDNGAENADTSESSCWTNCRRPCDVDIAVTVDNAYVLYINGVAQAPPSAEYTSGEFPGCSIPDGAYGLLIDATTAELAAAPAGDLGPRIVDGGATGHSGFSGAGFVDFRGPADETIEFGVPVSVEGMHTVAVRYALAGTPGSEGGADDRPLELSVNGNVISVPGTENSAFADDGLLHFPPTGDWTYWGRTTSVQVEMQSGSNFVTLRSTGASGANIDGLLVDPVRGESSVNHAGDAYTGCDWNQVDRFKLSQPGPIVVGINARDAEVSLMEGVGGLIATVRLNGRAHATNERWKCWQGGASGVDGQDGWALPGFDDSAWPFATSLGANGVAPWGDVNRFATSLADPNAAVLLKENNECSSPDTRIGTFTGDDGLQQCTRQCASTADCQYFLYATAPDSGACWVEHTTSAECPEGWLEHAYNFYELVPNPTLDTNAPISPDSNWIWTANSHFHDDVYCRLEMEC
jgi:hypothetical protein